LRIYIVIPVYNEAEFISQTLESLAQQTFLPEKVVVVNDGSTDGTRLKVAGLAQKYDFLSLVENIPEEDLHAPGSKVIKAFYKGFEGLDKDYDIICKFDGDLIFPPNYLEMIVSHFELNPTVGMVGGFCTIEKNGNWEIENLTGKDHIRGALKAYRKKCFEDIGKLREAMGWDTVDELLAQYNGWQVFTDKNLLVKHLKPTGASYTVRSGERQGMAFYKLGYGSLLTFIASAKLAFQKKDLKLFRDYIKGYNLAKKDKQPFLVSEEESRFIRKLRWKKIYQKLF